MIDVEFDRGLEALQGQHDMNHLHILVDASQLH